MFRKAQSLFINDQWGRFNENANRLAVNCRSNLCVSAVSKSIQRVYSYLYILTAITMVDFVLNKRAFRSSIANSNIFKRWVRSPKLYYSLIEFIILFFHSCLTSLCSAQNIASLLICYVFEKSKQFTKIASVDHIGTK